MNQTAAASSGLLAVDPGSARPWGSKPRWAPEAARLEVDGELVVWHPAAQFALNRVGSALAVHFDGELSLADLVADLVHGVGLEEADARALMERLAVELTVNGVVEGLELPEVDFPHAATPSLHTVTGAPGSAEPAHSDDPSGPSIGEAGRGHAPRAARPAVLRVETAVDVDGNDVVVEHLSDGRRRMTTTVSLSLHDAASAGLLQATMTGERSPAELAPIDSCMGSKLRNFDDVPRLDVRCFDGRVRSVRCHDQEVLGLLTERFGDELTDGERGPISAFVVTPLEGEGPRRVFDGLGRRRGRPRTAGETVDLVDQMLGEAAFTAAGWAPDAPLALDLVALTHHDGRSILVPSASLDTRGLNRRLRDAGWLQRWTEVVLDRDGSIKIAGTSSYQETIGTPTVMLGADQLTVAQRVRMLIRPLPVPVEDRAPILERLAAFARSVQWMPFDRPLSELAAEVLR